VKVADNTWRLETVGFQMQVAVKVGDVPVVATAKQLAIRLPSTKKRTFPGVLTVTERLTDAPLYAVPDNESDPMDVVVSGV
jgi:hypothetical protein